VSTVSYMLPGEEDWYTVDDVEPPPRGAQVTIQDVEGQFVVARIDAEIRVNPVSGSTSQLVTVYLEALP
jgi:hypothetical protein